MSKPIIIGVDTRDLKIATTGTKTYLEELCREFRLLEGKEFHFVFFDTPIPIYTGKNKLIKLVEQLRFFLWKQLILPVKSIYHRCDVLFCTDFFVPLIQLGYRTVPVFHDAFFFEYPSHYNRIWLFLFRTLAVPAARRSPAVIVPSYYAKERVQHFTGIDAAKIHVVYEAPKTMPQHDSAPGTFLQEMMQGKEKGLAYLLYVGSFDKRKNLPVLIDAFQKLILDGKHHLRLVLAGKSSPRQHSDATAEVRERIRANALEEYILIPGYIPDADLARLYATSLLFVFPSFNEGFGLPVVECFATGLPVLVANNTCLPEIGGDAVIGFDPSDTADLYRQIRSLIDHDELRRQMILEGKKRLSLFSWKKAARELTDIFRTVAAR